MKTDYKQSGIDRRDERHTKKPEEEFRQPGKNKRDRPFVIMAAWNDEAKSGWFKALIRKDEEQKWWKDGSYRTREEAEVALERAVRKYSFCKYKIIDTREDSNDASTKTETAP